ncbi:LacI family transcriptional regulator [Cellulomonas marina]|uniref:DNA-binding transcriptional regulator, LacI/PurR family n=2 Tax=Cellulomonas marina TaxID=988821 RepID=A0A1I0X7L5_9CELL|nr:LacI family transcriptional regulator [Cellulomonas marina]SFA96911.1 DNA-binding transcriptional regulator, LacI/PurR family [Cellulomonas marina]
MRDVAALAGVSVKTVSRVVNLEPHTRPELVARVHAAIAELGWVASGAARTLRTGRTGMLGVGVAELRRPYLATLVEALVIEAERRGMPVAVEPLHGDPGRLRALLAARGRSVDAVVHVGPLPPGAPLDEGAADRPLVVVQGGPVAVDEVPPAVPVALVDRVDEDVVQAVVLIARHLAVMGRRRPVLLGPDRAHGPAEDRARPSAALRAALAAAAPGADPAPGPPLVALPAPADRAAGARAAVAALAAHPGTDVLLCTNDEVALGALAGLAAAGVMVPQQVAVVGYDALDDGRFSAPTLTTVDPGPRALARAALELVHDRLVGAGPAGPRTLVLPVELVRRGSTLGEAAT